jgi:hypothetical protein
MARLITLGPVYEGDTLRGDIATDRIEPLPGVGGRVHEA